MKKVFILLLFIALMSCEKENYTLTESTNIDTVEVDRKIKGR